MLGKLKRIDLPIVLLLVGMMVFSTLVIYSATVGDPKFEGSHVRNLFNYGVGFVLFFAVAFFDYRWLIRLAPYLYGLVVLLLAAVLKFGEKINGAKGWFKLPGGLSFQPAEAAKFALVIMLTAFLCRRKGEPLTFWRDVVPIMLIMLVPFGLMLVQPDLGNAMIYLFILLCMLWIGNIKYIHVAIGTSAIAAGLTAFFFYFDDLKEPMRVFLENWLDKVHWVDRIDSYLNPETVDPNLLYQIDNAYKAIGSGQLLGEGFMQGNSVHKGFVPLVYADSIIVVIGEEFGFVGTSLLLLAYFLLVYRMILIAIQSYDIRGAYLIVGIVSLFVFQIFLNVAMHLKMVPFTGITLPFVSYGGTSLIMNMAGLGLVASVRIHQEKPLPYATEDA